MKIKVNGNSKEITEQTLSITQLLVIENVANPEMVSVQKNGEFIQKDSFDAEIVKDGDEVDFLFFMGGGQHSYELLIMSFEL